MCTSFTVYQTEFITSEEVIEEKLKLMLSRIDNICKELSSLKLLRTEGGNKC